jgi:phosphatidylglycerophosphatase A
MNRLAVWIATSGPAGYAPVAPGTAGSLVGLVIYLLIAQWSLQAQLLAAAAIAIVGIWAGSVAARHFNRSDPSHVVIDEVAGQVVTLIGLGSSWVTIVLGFLVFRALDIIKPWPANRLEAMHGGTGIMADDLMAAVYGQIVMRALFFFLPGLF